MFLKTITSLDRQLGIKIKTLSCYKQKMDRYSSIFYDTNRWFRVVPRLTTFFGFVWYQFLFQTSMTGHHLGTAMEL
jgi:hypothetical protein